jgi:hypothetical protein
VDSAGAEITGMVASRVGTTTLSAPTGKGAGAGRAGAGLIAVPAGGGKGVEADRLRSPAGAELPVTGAGASTEARAGTVTLTGARAERDGRVLGIANSAPTAGGWEEGTGGLAGERPGGAAMLAAAGVAGMVSREGTLTEGLAVLAASATGSSGVGAAGWE